MFRKRVLVSIRGEQKVNNVASKLCPNDLEARVYLAGLDFSAFNAFSPDPDEPD